MSNIITLNPRVRASNYHPGCMIDWVKARIPFRHSAPINGGNVYAVDNSGELEWQVSKRLAALGSFESAVQILSCNESRCLETGDYTHLLIDGNLVKYFQGHNLWGTDNLLGLVSEFALALSDHLGIKIPESDFSAISSGNYQLLRIDSTLMISCESNANVDSILYSIERMARMRYKGSGQVKGSTLYFGKNSRRESLKMYNKAKEINVKGHKLPASLSDSDTLHKINAWVSDKLRIEAVTRSMQLKELSLNMASDWESHTPFSRVTTLLGALDMSENHTLTPEAIHSLSPRLRFAYTSWKDGHDVKKMVPLSTFKHYRKQLKDAVGIDIAIIQGNGKEPTPNVVDFRRILTPEHCQQVPDFAHGTHLYFQPRVNFGGLK